jgi:hypothetical protein
MFKKMSGLIQVGEHPALFIYNILLSVIAKDRTRTRRALEFRGILRSTWTLATLHISGNAGDDEFLAAAGCY